MQHVDINNHGLRVINFESIFASAYKDIVKDLYMYEKFNKLFKNNVRRIDFIIKMKNGVEVKQYFIHIKHWYRDYYLDTMRLKLLNRECINIIHKNLEYFKCYLSISKLSK